MEKSSVTRSFRIPKALLDNVTKAAIFDNRTVNNWLVNVIDQHLKKIICEDCGRYYWAEGGGIGGWGVETDLWQKFGNGKGHLCIGCFEKRLGRRLTKIDFSNTVDNQTNSEVQKLCVDNRN